MGASLPAYFNGRPNTKGENHESKDIAGGSVRHGRQSRRSCGDAVCGLGWCIAGIRFQRADASRLHAREYRRQLHEYRGRRCVVAVSLSSALALAELPVPGQQTVRVLALVARRLAHLVEDAHPLAPVRLGIRPASRADVFVRCLSRHVSHASILLIVSSIWQTGLSKTLSAFVKSVRYYGKLRG